MQPTFKKPETREEFLKRADEIDVSGAKSILSTLYQRRAQLVKSIDEEIEFYQQVLNRKKGTDNYEYPHTRRQL